MYGKGTLGGLYFKYSWCMVQVIVQDESGGEYTGTGFHIGNGLIATARHVVESKQILSIIPEAQSEPLLVKRVHLSGNEKIDVAVIETDFSLKDSIRLMSYVFDKKRIPASKCKAQYLPLGYIFDDWLSTELVLSKCVVLGYPPIPTTIRAELVGISVEINAVVDSYLIPHAHFILSGIPRGGFSGAPVISEYDFVLGVATGSFSRDYQERELGFFGAVSVEPLLVLLGEKGLRPEGMDEEFWRFLSTGE